MTLSNVVLNIDIETNGHITVSQNFYIVPFSPSDASLTECNVSFLLSSHLHKLLLGQRGRGLAAGVELLVEELDDAHVVLDAEVVEERLADLKRTKDSVKLCLIFV